jgi:hypothetical protein
MYNTFFLTLGGGGVHLFYRQSNYGVSTLEIARLRLGYNKSDKLPNTVKY